MRWFCGALLCLSVHVGCGDSPPLANESPAIYACDPNPPAPIFPPGYDQIGNPAYCPALANPAFALGQGPRVLFDEGHHNWGTVTPIGRSPAAGVYFAFGELLKADGYVVEVNQGSFDREMLRGYDLVVVSHPLVTDYFTFNPAQGKDTYNPAAFVPGSALTADEIAALRAYVEEGGALLMNAEHLPFTGAANSLTAAFDMQLNPNGLGGFSLNSTFAKSSPAHPIFAGRSADESIGIVPYVAGGTRIDSASAEPLFEYPAGSVTLDITVEGYLASFEYFLCIEDSQTDTGVECDYLREQQNAATTTLPGEGSVAARADAVGSGRVVLFTEFATLSNQLVDADLDGVADSELGGLKAGDQDATQLVLNAIHWLTFVI